MFEFRDGQQYFLSTKSGSNKSVLFVKLTDSALHSIESFLNSEDEVTKPTIQFEGNNGTITVPQNGEKVFYGFTLSNFKADGSCFQCLQHTNKKSLKSLASMHVKMQVHANEDSYVNTKCKMAAADKEQKSLRTKEIKPNGKHFSKKSIFKHPGGVFPIKAVPFVKAQEHSGFLKPKKISNNPLLSKEPIRKKQNYVSMYKKKNEVNVNKCDNLVEPQSKKQRTSYGDNNKAADKTVKVGSSELNSVSAVKPNGVLDDLLPIKVNGHSKNHNSTVKTNGVLDDILPIKVNGHSKNGEKNGESPKFDFDSFLKLNRGDMAELNGSSRCDDSSSKMTKSPKFVSRLHYFMPNFVKITSDEQRAEYAKHFNSIYADYLNLHKGLKDIARKVCHLDNQLKNCEEGSEEYELYRKEIMKIYKQTALSVEYKTDWQRFHVLQKSLEKIKKLVTEYDNEAS